MSCFAPVNRTIPNGFGQMNQATTSLYTLSSSWNHASSTLPKITQNNINILKGSVVSASPIVTHPCPSKQSIQKPTTSTTAVAAVVVPPSPPSPSMSSTSSASTKSPSSSPTEFDNNKNVSQESSVSPSSTSPSSSSSSSSSSRHCGKSVQLRLEKDGEVVREFASLSHAAEVFGVSQTAVTSWCRQNKKRKGFWWYKQPAWWELPLEKICMTTGNVVVTFDSAVAAAKAVKVKKESIFECLCGRRKSCQGFFWRYKGSKEQPRAWECQKRAVERLSLETGIVLEEYESLRAAATAVKTFREGIRACATGRSKSSAGYFWRYKGSNRLPAQLEKSVSDDDDVTTTSTSTSSKPIKDVATDKSDDKNKEEEEESISACVDSLIALKRQRPVTMCDDAPSKNENEPVEEQPRKRTKIMSNDSNAKSQNSPATSSSSSSSMQTFVIGKRLRLLGKRDNQWSEGTIVSYDKVTQKHLIRLDGKHKKVHVRLDKILIEWQK